MNVNSRIKKALSFLLVLSMMLQYVPMAGYAAAEGNLCEHHSEHTAECGYAEGESECTYHCDVCLGHDHDEEEVTEPEIVCDCETDDAAYHATSCPMYVVPEAPQCYCTEKCTEPNIWCDICGFDVTACAGSEEEQAITLDEPIIETWGDLTWVLLSDGSLTISGSGPMSYEIPWKVYNSQITKVDIQEGVTTIASSAFYECFNLTSVSLPSTLTTIGSNAFYRCLKLESIEIPASVTSIYTSSFASCSAMTGIWVDEANETYSSDENGVLFSKDKTKLIFCPRGFSGSYKIPDGVATIGSEAFETCTGLSAITIADTVMTIEYDAFYGCTSLNNFIIPGSVATIGSNAFYNCDGLTSVEIPGSVVSLGERAFGYCDQLTSVTMGNGLVSIGDSAFIGCVSLTDVTLPDSLVSINYYSFSGCSSLSTITIPKKVSYIDYGAFDCTSQLKEVKFEGNAPVMESSAFYHYNARTITAYYPEGDATWTDEVFNGSYGATFTWIPYEPDVEEEEEVPVYIVAQGSCGISVSWMIMSDGRLIIFGSGAMQFMMRSGSAPWSAYADLITSIEVTSGVESIADNAFSDCSNVTTVSVADTVTSIGAEAFAGCESLETVSFAGDAPEIGENAFENVEATIQYPVNNDTWTEEVQESLGDTITLVANTCDHSYNQEVAGSRISATCVANGSVIMACECGATETQVLPVDAENHTGNTTLVGAVEATDTTAGYTGDTVCECGTVMEYGEVIPATYLLGDVTGDGKVTAADYSRLLAHVKKTNVITDETILKAADVTGDGKVTATDYSRILAHVKKIALLW